MSQVTQFELPPNLLKNLIDKHEEKRESAWKQIEIIVTKNADKRHLNQIDKIIAYMKDKYIKSIDLNKKIAGLEAMPGIINGLKNCPQGITKFAQPIVITILDCLNDPQHKVRLAALKSLYYIAKTLDDKIIKMFNLIFEKIIGKINDLQQVVRNAANFFDKSMQTILTSALNSPEGRSDFDLEGFMNIIKTKIKSMNPGVRQFLIKWIINLNQIMSIDLLTYLPDLLEDLLFMLGDKEKNLRNSSQECLKNFQADMKEKFQQGKLQNYLNEEIINKILVTLIKMAKGKNPIDTKLNVLSWLKTLFTFFRVQVEEKGAKNQKMLFKKIILERFDEILQPILILMSNEQQQIRKASISANDILMQNINLIYKQLHVNFGKVIPLLKEMLAEKKSNSTSQSALKWMKFLLQKYNDKILPEIKQIIEKLVQKLCQAQIKNVNSIIENTTVRSQYFQLLIKEMLLLLFNKNQNEYRPQQILKKFSLIQDGDKFCKSICSQIVKCIDDKLFIFQIVHHLNIIIINQRHMVKMRKKLQNLQDKEYTENFMILFHAFKYNPAALTSLCFMARQYRLANDIIMSFSDQFQVDPEILKGFCKLAGLIQSPGFLSLRLRILQGVDQYLIESLAALLMILPQGKIFNMLKNRLQITRFTQCGHGEPKKPEKLIDLQYCMSEYRSSQGSFTK